jgi:hypothetical protein
MEAGEVREGYSDRSPSPAPRSANRTVMEDRPRMQNSAPQVTPTLEVDAAVHKEPVSKVYPVVSDREAAKAISVTSASAIPQQPYVESPIQSRPRSPSLIYTRGFTKTPTTPMSPQGRSPLTSLPPKPDPNTTAQTMATAPSATLLPPPMEQPKTEDFLLTIKAELKEKFNLEIVKEDAPWDEEDNEVSTMFDQGLQVSLRFGPSMTG